MAPEIPFSQRVIIGIILAFVLTFNFTIALVLYKKNSQNIKPMNVFQANYFVGLGLLSISAMVVLLKDLDDIGKICPKEFLRYFLKISNIYDVVILQLDRLVAVRYPYYYNEKMDVSISLKIVGISKIISVAITVIASIIDPVFVFCPACGRCLFVRSINVYTVCYPGLSAFILTLAVSTYITKIVYTVNSVQPVVHLPTIGRTVNVIPANLERDAIENEELNDHIEQEETESLEVTKNPELDVTEEEDTTYVPEVRIKSSKQSSSY